MSATTPCGTAPRWAKYRASLVRSAAGKEERTRFDRVAAAVIGPGAGTTRRQFLGAAGRGAVVALALFGAGPQAAARGLFGRGLLPSAWDDMPIRADTPLPKPGMIVHGGQAFNGEFPPHLLDDPVTPTVRHFVRNNGGIPPRAQRKDLNGWVLRVDGEVRHPLALTLEDLLCLPQVTMQAVLECAGNGRSLFTPPVGGTPWMRGAVACSEWTGVRLRDVLELAGLRGGAVYVAAFGEDPALAGGKPFSRGIPIGKAMDEHTLIALAMNGEPLPAAHGFPARLLVPGWIGSAMQKWLNRLWVRDREHDSAKMSGYSYRVPAYPVAPGAAPPAEDMRVATAWVVKSLITRPRAEREAAVGESVQVGGHAWAGDNEVVRVAVSTDFGITWQEARLTAPANRYAWHHWQTEVAFPHRGYYEIWARAFDDTGAAQPFRQPWNPKGYLGNVVHRVPVLVAPAA